MQTVRTPTVVSGPVPPSGDVVTYLLHTIFAAKCDSDVSPALCQVFNKIAAYSEQAASQASVSLGRLVMPIRMHAYDH